MTGMNQEQYNPNHKVPPPNPEEAYRRHYQERQNWTHPQPQYMNQQGQWVPNPNYPNPALGSLGFFDAIKICFQKYCDFQGRAPRAEFWWFQLFVFLVCLIPGVNVVAPLVLFIPSLAVMWRRLHDIGKGGGWYFIGLIPLVGFILLLIWTCRDGEPYPNRFGPNPYGYNYGQFPPV